MQTELMTSDIEALAQAVEAHSDFQVLRRFIPKRVYDGGAPMGPLLKGIVLDTETTGRDVDKDAIIELGMVVFEFCPVTGRIYRVLDVYDELEDPGFPIPVEASAVNHITDEMVAGKRLDDQRVIDLVADADIIIAHNASFDRPLCEKRFPVFIDKAWACSLKQIDWEGEGLPKKLEYLVTSFGMFYEAHRAEMDCHAVLEVLNRVLPKSGQRAMKLLYDKHSHVEKLVYAMDTKFETKDILKERGYSWSGGDNGKPKAWYIRLADENYQAEVEWLTERVYNYRKFLLNHEPVDAISRYSRRSKGITPGWVVPVKPVVEGSPVAVVTPPVKDSLTMQRELADAAHIRCDDRLPDDVVPVAAAPVVAATGASGV
jgi:DNA polymerase III subunit epsilon